MGELEQTPHSFNKTDENLRPRKVNVPRQGHTDGSDRGRIAS